MGHGWALSLNAVVEVSISVARAQPRQPAPSPHLLAQSPAQPPAPSSAPTAGVTRGHFAAPPRPSFATRAGPQAVPRDEQQRAEDGAEGEAEWVPRLWFPQALLSLERNKTHSPTPTLCARDNSSASARKLQAGPPGLTKPPGLKRAISHPTPFGTQLLQFCGYNDEPLQSWGAELIPSSELNTDQFLKKGVRTQSWHLSPWAPAHSQLEGLPAGPSASKQREALCVRSATLPTSVAAPPACPGNPDLTAPKVLLPVLHAQRCSPDTLTGRAPRVAAVRRPGVCTAGILSPFTPLLPHLYCKEWECGGREQSPRNRVLPKAFSAPKQNNNVRVSRKPLTCFPLLCLRLFPPPLDQPFR